MDAIVIPRVVFMTARSRTVSHLCFESDGCCSTAS